MSVKQKNRECSDDQRVEYTRPDTGSVRPESQSEQGDSPSSESGGPKGLEPTRYGDWEKAGRCIDF